MAFENRQKGTYFTIYNGKITLKVDPGTPGAVTRVNKQGNTVHEVYYDSFSGKLVDIKTKESQDYGKSWIFVFEDGGDTYNLNLSYSNSFATNLLKMLKNLDLSKPFKVTPSSKVVDNKTQNSLFINQDDKPIKHAFTRDNPNGLPDLEEKIVKGNKIWDDTNRLVFLQAMVDSEILPKLRAIHDSDKGNVAVQEKELTADEQFDAMGSQPAPTGADDDDF